MKRPGAALVVTLLLLFATASALPAELGRLTVLSQIGQPLNAQIEVLSLAPGDERRLAPRLADRPVFSQSRIPYSPALADLTVSLERRGGRTFLRLRTAKPLSEPVLQLVLELYSGADLQISQYTISLAPPGPEALPPSREALFGVPSAEAKPAIPPSAVQWRGFVQNTAAYTYEDASHWSRAVIRTQLGAQGGGARLKWKASARVDVDPVYAGSDFYPSEVRRDQRRDFFLRETYIDTSLAGIDLRLGKQNIVWGEMVGLFFADVVSARDQRDFILPEFDVIRIPQWALRAERFGDNTHAELIWLPAPEVDRIGQPGAEFYPLQAPPPAGFAQQIDNPLRPARNARNSNFGVRASMLRGGWDLAAFYYRSTDVNPTFYREVLLAPAPTVIYTPRHDRIWQVGGTLGKDLGPTVLKAEAIYTSGRRFNVTRPSEPLGVVPQETLDYVVGLDFTLGRDTRLNLQYFDRVFRAHDPDLLFERREDGFSVLLSTKIGPSLEPELLAIRNLNRSDQLVRAKIGWIAARNWRLTLGADVFSGPVTGLFGRFADRDRVYLETRYDF